MLNFLKHKICKRIDIKVNQFKVYAKFLVKSVTLSDLIAPRI